MCTILISKWKGNLSAASYNSTFKKQILSATGKSVPLMEAMRGVAMPDIPLSQDKYQ